MSRINIIIVGVSALLTVALITGAVLLFLHVASYKIPQNGMYPDLPAGSRLLAWKRAYKEPADVKRGDIVVFRQSWKDDRTYTFIWRVIALPGEKVKTDRDALLVDGQPATRELLRTEGGFQIYRESIKGSSHHIAIPRTASDKAPPVDRVVPEGMFFLMGDNRHHALDSRFLGPVPFQAIIGRKF